MDELLKVPPLGLNPTHSDCAITCCGTAMSARADIRALARKRSIDHLETKVNEPPSLTHHSHQRRVLANSRVHKTFRDFLRATRCEYSQAFARHRANSHES